jgi:hypothetical protein
MRQMCREFGISRKTGYKIFNRDKKHWGARKIRELLVRRLAGDVRVPAKSTVHAVLDRYGLVKRRGRTRRHATGTTLSPGAARRPTSQ